MKLSNTENQVLENTLTTKSQSFKINACSQAFKILTDNLYEFKIPTIVRELSCNAWDSQIAAGNKDKPFLIHLPDQLEPHFSIRDYGTGLSKEDIFEIYTTYFQSTKNESNDFIGAFGLGSKTPLCYTEQFSVVSFFNGKKMTFLIHMNDQGFPEIQEVSTIDTDEPNGLEVAFAVSTNDFYEFEKAVLTFYQGANIVPKVINPPDSEYRNNLQNHSDLTADYGNLKVYKKAENCSRNNLCGETYAKLGLVLYSFDRKMFSFYNLQNRLKPTKTRIKICRELKITTEQYLSLVDKFNIARIGEDFLGNILSSYNKYVVIEFPIGSLSVQASRERLSFDESTKSEFFYVFIRSLIQIAKNIEEKSKKIDNFERYIEYCQEMEMYGLSPSRKRLSKLFVYLPNSDSLEFNAARLMDNVQSYSKEELFNPKTGIKIFSTCNGDNRNYSEVERKDIVICNLSKVVIANKSATNGERAYAYTIYVGRHSYMDIMYCYQNLKTPYSPSFCYIKLEKKYDIQKLIDELKKRVPDFVEVRELVLDKDNIEKPEPYKPNSDYNSCRKYLRDKAEYRFTYCVQMVDLNFSDELINTDESMKKKKIFYTPFNKLNLARKQTSVQLINLIYNEQALFELKKVQIEKLKSLNFQMIDVSDEVQFPLKDLVKVLNRKKFIFSQVQRVFGYAFRLFSPYVKPEFKKAIERLSKKTNLYDDSSSRYSKGNAGEVATKRIEKLRDKYFENIDKIIDREGAFKMMYDSMVSNNNYLFRELSYDSQNEVKKKFWNILMENEEIVNKECNESETCMEGE